ncbi:hypothetical protein A2U01_0056491, partial [Trifolium medium]|nr:hypothetical protein [Trifolium medium]
LIVSTKRMSAPVEGHRGGGRLSKLVMSVYLTGLGDGGVADVAVLVSFVV